MTNGSVTKVGTATVGDTANGIYLKSGTPTALSSTVGSGTKPIYSSSGTLTASSSTVGSSTTPVYLNSGTVTACGESIRFVSGDTISLTSGTVFAGYLTNSKQTISFLIPLSKPCSSAPTLEVTKLSVRQGGSYLLNEADPPSDMTISVTRKPNIGAQVNLVSSSGWGGTNNDTVTLQIWCTLTF